MGVSAISEAALAPAEPGFSGESRPAAKQPVRVFLVEDSADDIILFRHLLVSALPDLPIHLAAVGAASEALRQLQQARYDVLFFDYQLGVESGLDLLREVRRRGLDTPVVFLTGHGDEEIAVEAMKCGACDYLRKSKLDASDLQRAVRFALSLHHQQELVQQAQEELRRREERFRALVENAFDATVLLDASGTILWASNSNRRVLGLKPEERVGTNAFELLHPEDRNIIEKMFELLRQKPGESVPVDFRHRHPDGSWRNLEGVATNRLSDSPVGAIVFNFRDSTERRRAEEKLRKLSSAVEQSADMVVITDHQGVIEYVNPAFEQLTGYAPAEALGHTPRLLKSGVQDASFYRDLWQTILRGEVYRGVLINRKKSGELYYAEKSITPVRDPAGRVSHFISSDRDITERRKLEEQLVQAQKMDAIGQLAGGIAHDFNNLLMVISSYAELMLDVLQPENPLRHHGEEILKASRRAADLTRQLLTFSRKQVQTLRVLDLNGVLREISRLLARLIGEDIQLSLEPGKDLWLVKADPVQIEQIIMNLATNARDAMPHGGRLTVATANIELDETYARSHAGAAAGGYVRLSVSDSGSGIDAAILPRIFEPFFTTKEKGRGTGLGLSTVYGIVKQSGGHIAVQTEPGRGTTFEVYLPRVHGAQKAAEPAERSGQQLRGSETVLLVEDEEAVRESEREFLSQYGYHVVAASNGEEALVAAGSCGPIHILVSDVVMPKMSGSQLAERLLSQRPRLKVLYVSGYAEHTILQHGLVDLGSNFLHKPFTLKALAAKIREVLEAGTEVQEQR